MHLRERRGAPAGPGCPTLNPACCLVPPPLQYAAYGATKAALAQLLKTLQREAAALPNVRINNLSPGESRRWSSRH